MARSAFLWITKAPEKFEGIGGSSITSLGRGGSIECKHLDFSGESFFNTQTGAKTGERQFQPLLIRKEIDKTSPLLWNALCNNWTFEAEFKFYQFPHVDNETQEDTGEQHFYTIVLKEARCVGMRMYLPTTTDETSGNPVPPMEEVKMVFGEVTWKYDADGDAKVVTNSWRGASP